MLHYKFHQSTKNSNDLIVLLHGFISDQSTFDEHIKTFTDEINVLTIDLPGHGFDQSSETCTWNFEFICQLLDDTLALFKSYRIFLHGYSMGGRIALYYALYGTCHLNGLILESSSPGIADEDDRIERIQIDQARAKVLEIAGLEIFVNDWEKLPLFQSQYNLNTETKRKIRQMRLQQNPVRLAKALREYGTGQMPNLWPKISDIAVPTCIIVGSFDEKFIKIGYHMCDLIPETSLYEVSGSGHTVHVEEMTEFDKIVLGFIFKEEQND